ncbi:MAG: PilC/PilY family type IV pilus protein, partial [Serpentinimonas sp.]|nr:PilC/PilY family type IV pilus protein [Serpentinimonas sp.]
GELRACRTSQTAAECQSSPVWNASDWLRPENAPVNGITPLKPDDTDVQRGRKIITSWRNSATGAFAKLPFRYNRLESAQKNLINADNSAEFGRWAVEFLRGDRSKEGRELRRRGPHALASIVNSNITYLGRSTERYSGPNFQGNLLNQDHKTYRDSTSNRAPVVYVGANDGKLHAFDATNGKELFAYVPGSMFFNDKLNAQVQPNFSHQYMLDSTPMVGDFQNSSNSNRWGTLLVGGLGGGGRGFYALNITEQDGFAGKSENLLASELPLWEFTSGQDSDLGYTYNEPAQDSASGRFLQIAKVASASVATGSWVVAVGNGYGSTSGKAVLYLLNAATGVARPDLDKLVVPAITTSNGEPPRANGLSTPTPVDTDGDGLVDTIYAGDLLGYVHKFAYTREVGTGSNAKWVLGTPKPPGIEVSDGSAWRYIGAVFRAVDNAGNPQPITTAIAVGPRCGAAGGLALSVGTGQLLERTDVTSTSPQMFFTFFDTGAVTPGSPKTPLLAGPDNLATLTTEQGRTTVSGLDIRNWAAPTGTTAAEGWKMPLQAGERVLGNATLPPDTGAVVFGVTQPRANACGADGGYVVAVDLCSGSTTTLTFDGQLVGAFKVGTSGVVKVAPGYRMLDGKLFAGSNQPPDPETTTPTTGTLADNLAPPGRYSWREVLGF